MVLKGYTRFLNNDTYMKLIQKERLASLDILRGADMFLLLFIGPVVKKIFGVCPGRPSWLTGQFHHVSWEGFAMWDIIMPLFLFMSGITIPFSMARYKTGLRPDRAFYLKLLRRFCLLFALGWIVQGNLLSFDWKMFTPYSNTLQTIAVGYLITALLFVNLSFRWQVVACVLLAAAYWIAFACTGMNLDPQTNIAMTIDNTVLGSHRAGVIWDAEGLWHFNLKYQYTWILSSLNFSVTVMLGCFAGQMLKNEEYTPARRAAILAGIGICLIAIGQIISPIFPIIKKIWSTSMTLYSGGICMLLIALTFYIVDVRGWGKGLNWLKIYGMNAITAYMIGMVIKFTSVSESILHGFSSLECYPVLIELANVSILFGILYLLYRNRIFLKV